MIGAADTLKISVQHISRSIQRASIAGGNLVDVLGVTFESYTYDGMGRVVEVQNDDSVVSRSYDSLNNVVSEQIQIGGMTFGTATSEYDGMRNRISATHPSGMSFTSTYDALGRVKSIADGQGPIVGFNYLGASLLEEATFASGLSATMAYNARRLPHTSDYSVGPVPVESRQSSWSADGDRLDRSNLITQRLWSYTYDKGRRLVRTIETLGGMAVSNTKYRFDLVQNRSLVSNSVPSPDAGAYQLSSAAPEHDSQVHQYSSTPVGNMTYDDNGNLISVVSAVTGALEAEIYYDYRNRMVRYDDIPGNRTHTYAYDGLGRRVRKVVDSGGASEKVLHYLYDGSEVSHVCEEFDASGILVASYLTGEGVDRWVRMYRDVTGDGLVDPLDLVTDDMGSVLAVVTSSGAVVERFEYSDYGAPRFLDANFVETGAHTSASGLPVLFTGRTYDAETGLYWYRTRYMHPQLGRFTSRDSLGTWWDLSSWGNGNAYAGNNPPSATDPFGQDIWIEGPSGGEPHGHQSICVGDPNGAYDSYSFGWDGGVTVRNGMRGVVYKEEESKKGGEIIPGAYRKTTPEEDARVAKQLEEFTKFDPIAYRVINRNCRWFSQTVLEAAEENGIGEEAPAPERKVTNPPPGGTGVGLSSTGSTSNAAANPISTTSTTTSSLSADTVPVGCTASSTTTTSGAHPSPDTGVSTTSTSGD